MTDRSHRPAQRSAADTSLADASPAPLFVVQDHRLRYVNPAFAALAGAAASELVGRASLDVIHPDDRAHLVERGYEQEGTGRVARSQFRLRRPDGTEIWVYATTAPLVYDGRPAIIGTAIEVTERRHAQEAVARSQRLEAIGRLAGSIAHDFNNLLQVVIGHAERLASGLPAESALQKSAVEIRASASRAAQITDRLLSLGQRQVLEPRSLDVPRLVADLRNAIQRRVGASVTLVIRRGRRTAPVRADRMRLIHVLAHLVDNAREAMADGGQLTVSTDVLDVDEAMRVDRPWLRVGSFMRLQVEDTGTGMDAAFAERAFEPFVTTKPKGRGAGLGLATVYGLVKQSNGFVWVESAPSAGTRVVVLLPIDASLTEAETRPSVAKAPHVSIPAAELPRVLLVEDEGAVRELLSSALERNGFDVVTAGSAEEALTLASPSFQILLSDISLPGMSGVQLARQLRHSLPSLRVLLMSGYAREEFASGPNAVDDLPFIPKPFATRTVVERLRSLIEPAGEPLRA
jgi:two-component system, cell cycle sensor histidine kinase and response regulator CckA